MTAEYPGHYGNVVADATADDPADGQAVGYSGESGRMVKPVSQYEDVFPQGVWATPQGATAPDTGTVTIESVPYRVYLFDGGTTVETMSNCFEILHGIDVDALNAGTLMAEAHIHSAASTTGAGVVKWRLDWCYKPPNAAPVAMPSATITATYSANQQFWANLAGAEFAPPAGGFGIGGVILFNIVRDPTATGDTYTDDAIFDQCALHMPFNTLGSRQRYVK
jgi:hypothetical protein